MINFRITSIVLLLTFSMIAQKEEIPSFKNPPGTIQLSKNTFIDKNFVTNKMYLEFLNSVKYFWTPSFSDTIAKLPTYNYDYREYFRNDSLINEAFYLKIATVDSIIVDNKYSLHEYFNNPKFQNYPVLNISAAQAASYCEWRSDLVLLVYAFNAKSIDERKKFGCGEGFRAGGAQCQAPAPAP